MLPGSTQDSSFAHSVNPNGNTPSTTFEKDPQDLRIVSRSNGEQRPSNPTPKHASKIVQNNSPNFQPNHGYYQGFCANGFTSTIYDHEGILLLLPKSNICLLTGSCCQFYRISRYSS